MYAKIAFTSAAANQRPELHQMGILILNSYGPGACRNLPSVLSMPKSDVLRRRGMELLPLCVGTTLLAHVREAEWFELRSVLVQLLLQVRPSGGGDNDCARWDDCTI